MIFWAIGLSIVTAIAAQYCNKKLLMNEPAGRVLTMMFLLCFIFSLAAAAARPSGFFIIVAVIGFANALAGWHFNQAVKVGLAQSIMLLPLAGVVGVVLSAIFLGEWKYIDPRHIGGLLTMTGLAGSLIAVMLFGTSKQYKDADRRRWILAAAIYIFVSGLVIFLIKYFAADGVPMSGYLVSWYTGTVLGSVVPCVKESLNFRIPRKWIPYYLLLGITTFGSMWGYYWALAIAPATVVFPVHSFLYVLGAVALALFVFREIRIFKKREWAGFVVGITGVLLLILGMYA